MQLLRHPGNSPFFLRRGEDLLADLTQLRFLPIITGRRYLSGIQRPGKPQEKFLRQMLHQRLPVEVFGKILQFQQAENIGYKRAVLGIKERILGNAVPLKIRGKGRVQMCPVVDNIPLAVKPLPGTRPVKNASPRLGGDHFLSHQQLNGLLKVQEGIHGMARGPGYQKACFLRPVVANRINQHVHHPDLL